MSQTLNKKQMDAILHSDLYDAFGVLGAHVITLHGQKQVAVRAFLRDAKEVVAAELDGERHEWPMTRVHEHGLFELLLPDRQQLFRYELRVTDFTGGQRVMRDPYSFWPVLPHE